MKRFFTILFLILAMSFFVSCSGNDEKEDLTDSTDTESGKSGDSSDTSTGDTGADTGDTDIANTDIANTDIANTDIANTDIANTDIANTDTGDTDTGDTDTGDTDTGDTDTGDTDTGDTDTGDTDTGDTDTGDTDTGDTDTGDTDTGDTDTGDTDTSDTDTSSECIEITLSNTELSYYKYSHGSEKYDIFKATYIPNTGSATSDTFYLEFYGLSENYDYTGEFKLAEINQGSDRGLFLYVHEDEYCDSYSGDCTHGKTYFQKAGTVNVISAEFNFQVTKMILLSAKLNGVVLEETGNSEKRACLKIKNDPKVEYHDYYY